MGVFGIAIDWVTDRSTPSSLDIGVGLMYSQATVRKVHDKLAPVPHAVCGKRYVMD